MSLQSIVGRSLIDSSEVIKSGIGSDILEAAGKGKIDITRDELRALLVIIHASVDKSMMNTVNIVCRAIERDEKQK